MTGLGHLPGFLQQRSHRGFVAGLLDRQDRQAVEGHAGQRGQLVLLRIGQQFFIHVLGLLAGIQEGIRLPQRGVEVDDLQCRQHALHRLGLLEQGARLVVVPDGVCDSKDGHRLIPGLHAIARGGLGLPRGPGMIGQGLGGGRGHLSL